MSDLPANILVVDDERPIRRFLRASLQGHGYTVLEAATGQEAMQEAAGHRPDVIILDLGLPDMDGTEVTRQLREWTSVPIIVLSVRDHESDKIAALDAGADDYLTKPFGVGELVARIRVNLRRAVKSGDEPVFEVDGLKVDLAHRQVTVRAVEVDLTPTEYDLLRLLVHNAGKVLTHRQILREIWGVAYEAESHLLRVNISNLRHKIEPDPNRPEYILTEPGVGYRLKY
jgi:two-component system KDP operon response regulator KdpE